MNLSLIIWYFIKGWFHFSLQGNTIASLAEIMAAIDQVPVFFGPRMDMSVWSTSVLSGPLDLMTLPLISFRQKYLKLVTTTKGSKHSEFSSGQITWWQFNAKVHKVLTEGVQPSPTDLWHNILMVYSIGSFLTVIVFQNKVNARACYSLLFIYLSTCRITQDTFLVSHWLKPNP